MKFFKFLLLIILLPIGCDDDDNPMVQNPNPSSCDEGFIENPLSGNEYEQCVPNDFTYYISQSQAHLFLLHVKLDNEAIDSGDWVGAFKDSNGDGDGDVCVGAILWNPDNCNNSTCAITLMGESSTSDNTNGYLQEGDIPIFKIFDTSTLSYFNVYATQPPILFSHGNSYMHDLAGCSDGDDPVDVSGALICD